MAIVDYTQAMTAGLGARLAYNKANRSGGGRIMAPRGEDLNQRHHRQAMEKSALAQSKANVDMTTSTTSDNKDKTKANISKMQADTARKDSPEAKAMAKAQLDNKKQENVKLALSNFSSHIPSMTQKSLPDAINWVVDTGGISRGLFPSDEKINGWSELEFKKYHSGLKEGLKLTPKGMSAELKRKAAENTARDKDNAAKAKVVAAAAKKEATDIRDTVSNAQKTLDRLTKRWGDRDSMPRTALRSYDKATEIVNRAIGLEPEVPDLGPNANPINREPQVQDIPLPPEGPMEPQVQDIPLPPEGPMEPQPLDEATMRDLMNETNGDAQAARELAKERGYSW